MVPEPDQAEIVTTLGALFTGFAQRNADLLTDVYTADADWVNAFGSVKNGGPEIVGYLRGLFADQNFSDGQFAAPPRSVLRVVTDEVVIVSTHLQVAGQGLVGGGAIALRDNRSARPAEAAQRVVAHHLRDVHGRSPGPELHQPFMSISEWAAVKAVSGLVTLTDLDGVARTIAGPARGGLQLKAGMPVMARPMIRMCTSSVPS